MKYKQFFVAGIGTEVGKTVVSAILTETLKADYWKPVQSGDLHHTDSHKIEEWTTFPVVIHPETYRLNTPASPHYSAAVDGLKIELSVFKTPEPENHLIVEGAGGLHVPLNDEYMMIDLMEQLELPVILVSRNYLGSINHTLLSIEALQRRNIPIVGIVFNGKTTPSTESYILSYTGLSCIGRVGEEAEINKETIKKYCGQFSHLHTT